MSIAVFILSPETGDLTADGMREQMDDVLLLPSKM
jgi:hypothetical protein